MKKKISLIIAGGVSLGAYEAGAITELMYALKYLNEKNPQHRFEIDVITGASAGSIIAALTAKIIFQDYAGLKRILYESWVKKADIKHLMQKKSDNSVLSNAFLFQLADEYLLRQGAIAPASFAPEQMLCAFSLTNQVGVDYGFPYKNPPELASTHAYFSSTFFSDSSKFLIKKGQENNSSFWEKLARTAIASSSFPLVFPPVFLDKKAQDFPYALLSSLSFLPGQMGYIDGGVFNNEPLKLAISLSKEQDGDMISKDRIFILIDPSASLSFQDQTFTKPQPFHLNAARLVKIIMGESQARDWLKMGSINKKIKWLDQIIRQLPSLINSLPEEVLSQKLDLFSSQVKAIVNEKKELITESHKQDYYTRRLSTIQRYYRPFYQEIKDSKKNLLSKRVSLLENMIFTFNETANLETKFPLHFYIISTEENKTGGSPYYSFGGFFKEEWREHDFRLGRSDAYVAIPKILGVLPYPKEGEINGYNPSYDPDPSWKKLSAETMADAPLETRELFAELIAKKMGALLENEPFNLSAIKLFIAKKAFKGLIRKSLKIPNRFWFDPRSWFS